MTLLKYIRTRMLWTQQKLASAIPGLTANDICRFERRSYLNMDKVIKLADFLGVSVDGLMLDNYAEIIGNFSKPVKPDHTLSRELETFNAKRSELGRSGEDWVYQRELEKLTGTPWVNGVNGNFASQADAGFDILSFTVDGEPVLVEVKATSAEADQKFYLTETEYKTLQSCLQNGTQYEIHRVYRLGTGKTGCKVISAEELLEDYELTPCVTYAVVKKTKEDME